MTPQGFTRDGHDPPARTVAHHQGATLRQVDRRICWARMLELDEPTREALFRRFLDRDRERRRTLVDAPVARNEASVREWLGPSNPATALDSVMDALDDGIVPTDHPRYFGLFNSATTALGVLADAVASAWNPQLATRGHAAYPVAAEERVLAAIGERFGYARDEVRGTFTSGGGEANVTALLCALATRFPDWGERGVAALGTAPRVYASAEGHATVVRAARLAGLGSSAVRSIPVGADMRMKTSALADAMARDARDGAVPLLVVATAGTTSTGAIDPLPEIARLTERHRAWLHVDAAGVGSPRSSPSSPPRSPDRARRTLDWRSILRWAMSAPMGTGALLTRRDGALERVFAESTGYMPRDGARDPYARSFQWSRRFIGLRVLLPLAVHGWAGHADALRKKLALAERLRTGLRASGWKLVAETPLPIVCFVDGDRDDAKHLDAIARRVIASNGGWLSVPRLTNGARALRACVNNHRTGEADVDRLLDALNEARGIV
ncbi:MAG: aminotransferase class V-fold PLP-dependent enzyme [Polyangiaceae bacterium]